VFLVPWPRHWVIGTTDAPYHGPVDRPAASGVEVDEIIDTVNRAMDVDLARDDVVGTYAGLRPLVAPADAGSTLKISRGHKVDTDADGLVRVSGGKYTTYRVMAADAVAATLGVEARRRPSRTADQPIHGALALDSIPAAAARLTRDHGLLADAATSLIDRHGTDADAVAALGASLGLLRPIAAGFPHLEAETVWAVRHEHALSLDDVLTRRTRLVHELRDRGASIAPRVAELVGGELGWDAERQATEVATFLASAGREFGIPAPADATASAPVRVIDPTGIGGTEPA
jgi:glycerol-3-phosphate dehydrogenase